MKILGGCWLKGPCFYNCSASNLNVVVFVFVHPGEWLCFCTAPSIPRCLSGTGTLNNATGQTIHLISYPHSSTNNSFPSVAVLEQDWGVWCVEPNKILLLVLCRLPAVGKVQCEAGGGAVADYLMLHEEHCCAISTCQRAVGQQQDLTLIENTDMLVQRCKNEHVTSLSWNELTEDTYYN